MRTICVVTGNRTDYGRVQTIMSAIKRHPRLNLQTVVIGAHLLKRHGYTVDQIVKDGFTPDQCIHQIVDGETPGAMARSIGLGVCDLATTFERLEPDIVIVPCDRFEILSAAVSASVMNIRVAHIQGGEVTGNIDESIRHAITKLAHIHFPATEESRERIIAMGENPNYVFNVGCPGTDYILNTKEQTTREVFQEFSELYPETHFPESMEPYILLVQHPVTTQYGEQSHQFLNTLSAVSRTNLPVICLWPNVDAGAHQIVEEIRSFVHSGTSGDRFFTFSRLLPSQFVNLMRNAACMVGNSSAGIRETCYMGTPVVNVGIRQQKRERGKNVIDVPNDSDLIYQAIMKQVEVGCFEPDSVYGDGQAGERIAEVLAEIDLPSIQKVIQY